jgi:hypothetical protein
MIPIKEPFPEPIDYNKIPIDQIPKEYLNGARDRLVAQAEEMKQFETGLAELSRNPAITGLLMTQAHKTVSRYDDHIIRSVFYTALSTYLSPLNLALKAESGAGKSYTTMEMVNFLPQENVLRIGSQSPKVISHENGIRKTSDGRNFDEIPEPEKPKKSDYPNPDDFCALMEGWKNNVKEYRKLADESYYEVDLRHKIIVFLESVNPETFKMLKATMSHDTGSIDHKFVDEHGKVHITRLIGAPVIIFNSLDSEYMEEFATRTLTATPDTSQEKIQDAMSIACKKANFPWLYAKDALNYRLFQEYIKRIRDLTTKGGIKALNPFTELNSAFSTNATRDMRDFSKFLELMPSFALFKLFQRPIITLNGSRYLIPTVQDAIDAKEHFDSVSATTKTGTEQRIINFYWEQVAIIAGSTIEQLTDDYNKGRTKRLSSNTIRHWIDRLEQLEWLDKRTGERERTDGKTDWKTVTVHPLKIKNAGDKWFCKTTEYLRVELEKLFESWLNIVSKSDAFTPDIIMLNIDGSANKLTLEEFSKIVRGVEDLNFETITQPKSNPIQQTEPEDLAVTKNTTSPNSIINYRWLAPNEIRLCDGEGKGNPCPHEAKYELTSDDNPVAIHYCEEHFKTTRISCAQNGFSLKEYVPSVPRDDSKDYSEPGEDQDG